MPTVTSRSFDDAVPGWTHLDVTGVSAEALPVCSGGEVADPAGHRGLRVVTDGALVQDGGHVDPFGEGNRVVLAPPRHVEDAEDVRRTGRRHGRRRLIARLRVLRGNGTVGLCLTPRRAADTGPKLLDRRLLLLPGDDICPPQLPHDEQGGQDTERQHHLSGDTDGADADGRPPPWAGCGRPRRSGASWCVDVGQLTSRSDLRLRVARPHGSW